MPNPQPAARYGEATPVGFDQLPWSWMDAYGRPNSYQSSIFLRAWIEHYAASTDPWSLIFSDDDASPSFVAPLIRERERRLWATVRIVRPVGWDFLWPGVCVPFSLPHLEQLTQVLSSRRRDWDILEFASVGSDCESLVSVSRVFERAGFKVRASCQAGYPYVVLDEPWDDYYNSKSRNLRKNIKWLRGKAERAGIQLARADGPGACEALDAFFALHTTRWARRGEQSVYTTGPYRALMQTYCRHLAETRACVVYSLVGPDRTIAAALCFVSGGTLHFHHTAFDAEFAELSPGKLLLYFVIRDAFNRGFQEINLGLSKDAYKYWWSNRERALGQFLVQHRAQPALWLDGQLRAAWRAARESLSALGPHRRSLREDRADGAMRPSLGRRTRSAQDGVAGRLPDA